MYSQECASELMLSSVFILYAENANSGGIETLESGECWMMILRGASFLVSLTLSCCFCLELGLFTTGKLCKIIDYYCIANISVKA